nr:zinc finger protein 91-like [Aedes albopictus]
MVAHRRVHAGLTPFFCETCEQAFATLLEMKLHHAEQHTQQKTWDCDHPDCKEQFATHQALRQHKIKIHDPNYTKPKPRVSICEACGDTFENSQKLRRHKFAVHEPEEKPYMCEICFLRFSLPHKLKKHMVRHEGIRNHVCPYCGVAKITKGELTSHIKNIHSKERGLVNDAYHAAFSNHHMDMATTSAEDAAKSEARPKKEKEWQRNVRKINRNNGKAYVRKDNVVVEGKSFQEQFDCGCPRKCRDKFESEAMLEQFFGSFWNLGDWHKQNALVADQVKGVDVNRHRPRSEDHPRSERTLQFQYFIPSRQDNVRLQEERVPKQVVESRSEVEALPPEVELDALQQQVDDEPEPPGTGSGDDASLRDEPSFRGFDDADTTDEEFFDPDEATNVEQPRRSRRSNAGALPKRMEDYVVGVARLTESEPKNYKEAGQ